MKYPPMLHLPMSNVNPGDRFIDQVCVNILTNKVRDENDTIYINELIDGLHLSVSLTNGTINCERRDGHPITEPNQEESIFMKWVSKHELRFKQLLEDGQTVHGEWILRAYGTKYAFSGDPYIVFDITKANKQLMTYDEALPKFTEGKFNIAPVLYVDNESVSIETAMDEMLGEYGYAGATDLAEGIVYRCERKGKVDFQAKFVRLGKSPIYMDKEVWNRPK